MASCAISPTARSKQNNSEVSAGYNALHLFLENQRYLTTVMRVKSFLTFDGISVDSAKLIDTIEKSSSKALAEMEKLKQKKPVIAIHEFPDDSIGKATFDALRMTAAKEFLFDPKNFEKNLLLSHAQLLRVISHLAEELEEQESNNKRKVWLSNLVERYEQYYALIYKRIALA